MIEPPRCCYMAVVTVSSHGDRITKHMYCQSLSQAIPSIDYLVGFSSRHSFSVLGSFRIVVSLLDSLTVPSGRPVRRGLAIKRGN